jgi:hypothetical protein
MRKTIMLGTVIALFAVGALAQANDLTTTEQRSSTEASQPNAPTVRGEENARDPRSAARQAHGESRKGDREHHDEARERDDENREHGARH